MCIVEGTFGVNGDVCRAGLNAGASLEDAEGDFEGALGPE